MDNPDSNKGNNENQPLKQGDNVAQQPVVDQKVEQKKEAIDYQQMAIQDIPIPFNFQTLLVYMGPGLLVCAGYLDPGNIAADITAGIENGNTINWAIALALVMCYFFQSVSMRLGAVTGKDMATLIRENVEDKFQVLLISLLVNVSLVAFDLLQVLGTAVGFQIILGVPQWVGVFLTLFSILLIWVVQQYEDAHGIEIIFVGLMLVMAFCFFTDLILSDPDWLGMVWGTVWPHIPSHKAGQIGILSLFGATLIPHNLFMQSGMVKDKKVDPKNRYKLAEIIRYSYIETAISIFFCLLINVAVIATFTNWNGSEDLKGDMKINMFTAGDFFEKELGVVAQMAYGIGLTSAGFSNMIPIAISCQYYTEGFFNIHISKVDSLLLVRIVTIFPAFVVTHIFGDDDIYDELNVFEIIMIPVALIPLLKMMRAPKLMGLSRMKNLEFYILATISSVMVVLNMYTLLPDSEQIEWDSHEIYFMVFAVIIYFILIFGLLGLDYDVKEPRVRSIEGAADLEGAVNNKDQEGELLPNNGNEASAVQQQPDSNEPAKN